MEESVWRPLFFFSFGEVKSQPGSVDSLSSNTIRTYRDCLWCKSTIDTKLTMMIDQNHPTMQAFGRTLNRDKGGARLIVSAGSDWSIETLQMSNRCLGYGTHCMQSILIRRTSRNTLQRTSSAFGRLS